MRFLPAILANVLLVIAAIGFGSLLQRLIPKRFSRFDRAVLVLLGGLGLLGTILFCVGQSWFSRSAILSVLMVGVLLSLRPLATAIPQCRPALSRIPLPVLPAAIFVVVLLITAIAGLALPIGGANLDAIAYHYLGPRIWLREQVVRPVPDEIETYFPVVVEAQYAALMSIGGQRAPGFFAVVSLCALALTTASLSIRLGLDPTQAWWAVALVATMPAVYRGAYGGFVDALLGSFVLAAAMLVFGAEGLSDFALFGIFCGISMATKYTGVVTWGLIVASSFVFIVWSHRRQATNPLKWLGVSCAVAILVASPLYLRNWILYGCPMYPPAPGLLRFCSATNISPSIMQALTENMNRTASGMGGGAVNFALLPFHLTYHTSNFMGGVGGIGLAPLALSPFGILARRRDPFAKGPLLFAILQVVTWFVTAQVPRYMIHVFVIGAIFSVFGWKYVELLSGRNGRILSAVAIGVSVLYGLWMIGADRKEDLRGALSAPYEEIRQWEAATPQSASIEYLNGEPSVRKVLVLDKEFASYYLEKPYIKPFGRWGEQTLGATSVAEVLSQLPRLDVTHVLDVAGKDGAFALPNHLTDLTLVFERKDQRIYRVGDRELGVRSNP